MEHTTWPELSFEASKDTYETIHLWTQIIGKIKLALNPWINHSWHSTLKVTTNGLTSDPIFAEDKQLEIILNFLEHRLEIISSDNEKKTFDLQTLKVSSCYNNVLAYLEDIGIAIKINAVPNEIEGAIPFHDNHEGT